MDRKLGWWSVTRRNWSMDRIEGAAMTPSLGPHRQPKLAEAVAKSLGQREACLDGGQIDAERHHHLRDRRPDTRYDAFRAHQPRRRDRFRQVLRRLRVHRRNAAD